MFAVTFKHSDLGYIIVSLVFLNGLVFIDVAAQCGASRFLPQARSK
jgi:hypothetical protein